MGDELRRARIDFGLPSGEFLIVGTQWRTSEVGEEVRGQTSLILLGELVHIRQQVCQRLHGMIIRNT